MIKTFDRHFQEERFFCSALGLSEEDMQNRRDFGLAELLGLLGFQSVSSEEVGVIPKFDRDVEIDTGKYTPSEGAQFILPLLRSVPYGAQPSSHQDQP